MNWKQALALGLCSVGAYAGQKEPVAYLYNGVRLPEVLTVEGYPKTVVSWNDAGKTTPNLYLVEGDVQHNPAYNPAGTEFPATLMYGHLKAYTLKDGEWVFVRDFYNDNKGYFGGNADRFIWANTDIYNIADGSLYFATSDPIPVYE